MSFLSHDTAPRMMRESRLLRSGTLLASLAALVLAAGCTHTDSVTVGAVPDDYRTNHPIVIQEKMESVDIPVGVSDQRMTRVQRTALDGFLSRYDAKTGPVVTVLVPHGSANHAAASLVAADMVAFMGRRGVAQGRILHQPYHAPADAAAPIRVSFADMRAMTAQPCGRWPADMLSDTSNRHWANFGCASQNNLAAQIANPADLLGPRRSTPIDAQNRSDAIDQYRAREVTTDFRTSSEIFY